MAEATFILQVLTLIVAGAGPLLAYRYARKLALSSNRQAWLDRLRQDVAELVAVSDSSRFLFRHENRTSDVATARDLGLQMQTLRVRIWLRLRSTNEAHRQLRKAIDAFVGASENEARDGFRTKLLESAEELIQRAWNRIEQGD